MVVWKTTKKTIEEQVSDLTLKLLKTWDKKEAAWLNLNKKVTLLGKANRKFVEIAKKTDKLKEALRLKQIQLKNS